MLRRLSIYASLIASGIACSPTAHGAETPTGTAMQKAVEALNPVANVAEASHDPSPAKQRLPSGIAPTNALLTEVVAWLSARLGLPAIYDHPKVEIVSRAKLAALRYRGILADGARNVSNLAAAAQSDRRREVVAVYDDKSRTIFLSDGWTGTGPVEISVLVHEMVHHLQNVGRLQFDCPAAREKPAYLAQDQWLARYGLNLETEFDVDKLTLIVTSACIS